MSRVKRIAFIGNSLPRRCGIATFTTDLQQAVAGAFPPVATSIVAMTDGDRAYDYPETVGFEIGQENLSAYVEAAEFINRGSFDAVSLQHEFGIFGGEAGSHILALLDRLSVPIVTTLHTVLAEPSARQRHVLERLLAISSRIVVMADKGRELLLSAYGGSAARIEVIPHGIPDFAFVEPDASKARLGFSNKTVILTFGLLSPNKGIEVMIDAMPEVIASRPDAVYVVLGATHPNLVREQGERYRESLVARATALGIADRVVFLNQFVDRTTLLEHISMCDVYVTPYLNQAQMTSGTLAYSFGLGKAVVSTPYWHATELLAGSRGILVPFGDAAATGASISALLTDEPRRNAMRRRAYDASRSMIWERVAQRYLATFEAVRLPKSRIPARLHTLAVPGEGRALPPVVLEHLETLTDDTGLLQHAIHSVPDRSHGYCVDDNARALLLATGLARLGDEHVSSAMTSSFAAFVQHAFNPGSRRFRNFMSFDRRWLEEQGSEDSHGRTLWALGATTRHDVSHPRRQWAAALFSSALPVVDGFASPRAWAFTLLGLDDYCIAMPDDRSAADLRSRLVERLDGLFGQVATAGWVWFEEGLSYDNARLSEAMIRIGKSTGRLAYLAVGLQTLDWLIAAQTTTAGLFRPVGTAGFHDVRKLPRKFDQQPVEAAATIAACLAAFRATGDRKWATEANRAFAWFLGYNDLSQPLVDPETGSCRDGLHPDRRNENRGAESVLSYLLGLVDMRTLERLVAAGKSVDARQRSFRDPLISIPQQPRGLLAASYIPQSAGPLSST